MPYLGYLSAFSRTKPGFLLLIVTPASILIVLEAAGIVRELRDRKRGSEPAVEAAEETA